MSVCMYAEVRDGHVHVSVYVEVRGQFTSVGSLPLAYMCSRDHTLAARLGGKCLHPLTRLPGLVGSYLQICLTL